MAGEETISWFEQILTAIQIIVTAFMAYLAYRINKGQSKIEKHIEVSEKAGLILKWLGTSGVTGDEVIELSNSGSIPIDEFEAKFDIKISAKKLNDISLKHEWECKSVLNSKESAVINLSEKLFPVYEKNKLMIKRFFDYPSSEKDWYGEYIMVEGSVKHLIKLFSVTVNIEVKSKVYNVTRTIKKKYRLDYDFKEEIYSEPPNDFQYDDNYTIAINSLTGHWKE